MPERLTARTTRVPTRLPSGDVGLLVALTLPGLVLLLLALAAVDQLVLKVRGRGVLRHRQAGNGQVSSTGFELLHAALAPGKDAELAQRHTEELVRDDEEGGAPPRLDLDGGVARLRLPPDRPAD